MLIRNSSAMKIQCRICPEALADRAVVRRELSVKTIKPQRQPGQLILSDATLNRVPI